MIKRDAIFRNRGSSPINYGDREWDFHNENTQQHLHSLHPYPARFIPQIPNLAIKKWSKKGDMVLDPFCGCGTTLVEAIALGRNTIGIDNNPVATLLSEAKTSKYTQKDISQLEKLYDNISSGKTQNSKSYNIPEHPNIDYWFSLESTEELGRIRAALDMLKGVSRNLATDAIR